MNTDKELIEVLLQRFRKTMAIADECSDLDDGLMQISDIADESIRLIEKHQQEPAVDMNDLLLAVHKDSFESL